MPCAARPPRPCRPRPRDIPGMIYGVTPDDEILMTALREGPLLPRIFAHAERAYPRECCGMIHRSGILRICDNAIDRLHAADPESFPRSSRDGYAFDVDDLRFLAESLDTSDPVRVVYHAHPDSGSALSQADIAAALIDGLHVYPTLMHLVIAVSKGRAVEAALHEPAPGGFIQCGRFFPR